MYAYVRVPQGLFNIIVDKVRAALAREREEIPVEVVPTNEVEVEVDVKSRSLANRSIEERASSTMLKVEGDFLIETSTMNDRGFGFAMSV
jgi:hypothetical protein